MWLYSDGIIHRYEVWEAVIQNNRLPSILWINGYQTNLLTTLDIMEQCMERPEVDKDEKSKEPEKGQVQKPEDNLFSTEEIRIEEMAIDGICGVY